MVGGSEVIVVIALYSSVRTMAQYRARSPDDEIMSTPEQRLIYELASKILELQYRSEALASLLRSKCGVTPEELMAAVEACRSAREAALRKAGKAPAESILDFLQEFEGPKQ